ncbi:NAD-dependent succinate-semialdehyde dehydrogenase [Rhodococcus sp. NPDC059968]|uniref:NAD-dependent succinate-semialdehyde dehydrogenase n=1 Tax=Rhodococcus sp. NPDC059968 TaxID=3347017 RepID=UPI00366E68DB
MDTYSTATLYINGKWVEADRGASFEVTDPSSGQVIGVAADAGTAETERAIAAASDAFPNWRAQNAYTRAAALLRMHELMLERSEDLALLMSLEQGKPLRAARNEIRYAADFLIWFAEEAKRIYGSTIPSSRTNQRLTVLRQPIGVVAGITPWNYPVSMITRKVAPAIAAGCSIVVKPAEQTPLCARAVFDIFDEADLPPGVVNLITTSRPSEVGDAFLRSRAIRKLTFTGSTAVGKMLASRASESMKRVSLELGGHAPFIVFDDADVEHAAKGAALAKYLNTGQACISPNRIYVQRGSIGRFVNVLTDRARRLRPGSGVDESSTIGPLIDMTAVTKMEQQVADAVGKGAQVAIGGERLREDGLDGGNFFAPTVLTGVSPAMSIYNEETFGPIAPVIAFDTEDEVVAMANDTEYGLASYVYTKDLARAVRVSEALRFGIVGINDINPTAAAAPFGGLGESGVGREGGAQGIDEYLDVKLVAHVLGDAVD